MHLVSILGCEKYTRSNDTVFNDSQRVVNEASRPITTVMASIFPVQNAFINAS